MSQEKEYFWSKNLKDARKKTALDMLKGLALITGASSNPELTTVFSACFPENTDFLIPLSFDLPLLAPSLFFLQLYSGSLYRSSGDPSKGVFQTDMTGGSVLNQRSATSCYATSTN